MSVDQMRAAISKVYDAKTWADRVARMPDSQVIAIYYNFKEKGKFEKARRERESRKYKQMTIYDYI